MTPSGAPPLKIKVKKQFVLKVKVRKGFMKKEKKKKKRKERKKEREKEKKLKERSRSKQFIYRHILNRKRLRKRYFCNNKKRFPKIFLALKRAQRQGFWAFFS